MATCPAGHDSAHDDYCDECGAPLGGDPGPAPEAPAGQQCPACGGDLRDPVGRFCEACGHELARPVPSGDPAPSGGPAPVPAGWTALVRAERDWFDEVRARPDSAATSIEFPDHCPERRFELSGPRLVIGRRSRSRGTNPDIDLSGPPLDPGVSAMHAVLVESADGTWEVVDLDSTNGTHVGDASDPLPPHQPSPLRPGDRIKLGAWTTITVSTGGGPG